MSLLLDGSVESVVDAKKLSRDTPPVQREGEENFAELINQYLGTYSYLGCLLCYAHSCEHGEHEFGSNRRIFSMEIDTGQRLADFARQRLIKAQRVGRQNGSLKKSAVQDQPCKNQCFRSFWCRQ